MADATLPANSRKTTPERLWPWAIGIAFATLSFIFGFFVWWAWQGTRLALHRNNLTTYPTRTDWQEEFELCLLGALLAISSTVFIAAPLFVSLSSRSETALAIGAIILFALYVKVFWDFLFSRD
jgi:hypothetical protein